MKTLPVYLNEVRQRADAATKGPWESWATVIWSPDEKAVVAGASELRESETVRFTEPNVGSKNLKEIYCNTAFIAHARQDIETLLEIVRLQGEALEKIQNVSEARWETIDVVNAAIAALLKEAK